MVSPISMRTNVRKVYHTDGWAALKIFADQTARPSLNIAKMFAKFCRQLYWWWWPREIVPHVWTTERCELADVSIVTQHSSGPTLLPRLTTAYRRNRSRKGFGEDIKMFYLRHYVC